MSDMHKGHRERMKKYFLDCGLDSLSDHQVLELLLFYCVPRRDTNELAHKMIKEFGSLYNLFDSDPHVIARKCEVSLNVAILIAMMPQIARRYYTSKFLLDRPVLNSTKKIGNYGIALMLGRTVEHFFIICLNSQRKLIESVLVAEGTVDETPIYPRKIVEIALKYHATSIVLLHNHPGGSFLPSQQDIDSTRKIISVLEPINIEVLDHIIISGNEYYSFVENGILD